MQKIDIKTVNGSVTGTTPVAVVIPELQKSRAVVRRFSAVGNDAGSKVKWYLPKAAMEFKLVEALAAAGTSVKVPADVAGGHAFKGYTMASTSKLLLLTSSGWALVDISAVADVAGKGYCACTISAVGVVIPANTRAYVVRPADLVDSLPAIGAASVTVEDFISGDAGAPVVFTIESASAKTCIAAALVEYFG
jgi:hypothetical protein